MTPQARRASASGRAPVTALVLAKDEEPNIARCIASLGWCQDVVVVDSGSSDDTVAIARAAGARVITTGWRGYAAQREWALRQGFHTDWVYFVDADEWVTPELADEVTEALGRPDPPSAFSQGFRLVWQGRWIRHCGWYPSAPIVRLVRPDRTRYDTTAGFSEHPIVEGPVGRLQHDIVDEDLKGLARWLHKHVEYAVLEARRRGLPQSARRPQEPLVRHVLRTKVAPRLPFRPLFTFVYMYVLRAGFLDGATGLRFCLMHAWFQLTVDALREESRRHPSHPPEELR